MSDQSSSIHPGERRALIRALGVDLDRLDLRARAAIEALCEEVLANREETSRLRQALAEAELLADHDPLCPLFNRRAFEREVRREIAVAARLNTPLSLIFVDLDRFKQVNDWFGHTEGDRILLAISGVLTQLTRETDIVGRLGGDEFGIVLSQATAADAQMKVDRIVHEVEQLTLPAHPEAKAFRIGASCGVAQWEPGLSAEGLISLADRAMYAQKARRHDQRTDRP